MMATVFKKVKLGNKIKSETVTQNDETDNENGNQELRMNSMEEKSFSDKKRRRGLLNVCTGPADSVENRRRRNRPQARTNPQTHLTLFRSLQLRIDLWTSTTGHLLDTSFARRFCHRKSENELYRSNSFRFEKFDKDEEEDLQQPVSLCDDYSLPVDFVNKRKFYTESIERCEPKRPIDVAENYFDPKDSRVPQRPKKNETSRCQQQQYKRHSNPVDTNFLGAELRSNLTSSVPESNGDSAESHPLERRPSPYYYSDLLSQDDLEPSAFKSYRKPQLKTAEPIYTQSSKQVNRVNRQLESYQPFSAKENLEPKQGGLDFYDFASGKVRKKHRVVEVKRTSARKTFEEEEKEREVEAEDESIDIYHDDDDGRDPERNERNPFEYSAILDLSVGSLHTKKWTLKEECKKSATLDTSLGENVREEVGEHSNKFRPIVPVKETEEGIEGGDEGDEEEENVKRDRKKSLKKLSQYNYNYKDCLTGAPRTTFLSENEFSPAEILQHVIHSGSDSKSLLAACLAEWDAHAHLMRPLTARALTQCACAIGAQKECESSDEDGDYHYSTSTLQVNAAGKKGPSQDTIRRRDFFNEPIPEGKNLGDEFIKGRKVTGDDNDAENRSVIGEGSLKSDKSLNAREIFCNWGIIVNEKGGFQSWNDAYDEHSDSAEAYRIAREIIEETENWDAPKQTLLKQGSRSTDSLDDLDSMGRRGLLYETAFDCKISRSDDDLEELDRVTNHPVLHSRIGRSKSAITAPLIESYSRPPRPGTSFSKNNFSTSGQSKAAPANDNAQELTKITDRVQNIALAQTPTPPSTAPLPSKFSGHEDFAINSIKSAPELSAGSCPVRIKDNKLPVKSLRVRDSQPPPPHTPSLLCSAKKCTHVSQESIRRDINNINNNNGEETTAPKPQLLVQNPGLILEFKGRPELNKKFRVPRPRSLMGDMRPVLPQRRPGRFKFSSTESMATSSSGGSLESIKSSTSEGNRSTTSSDSHRSTSLSSHSSDSSGNVMAITAANLHFHLKQTNSHHSQTNKLQNALSPISDKSSVDPGSETSDNNKNNNSQKASPEDCEQQTTPTTHAPQHQQQAHIPSKPDFKSKRKALQNKNLIGLALQDSQTSSNEAQGSDSGISVESRTARSSAISSNLTEVNVRTQSPNNRRPPQIYSLVCSQTDFSDLPFDMPKLRRRRLGEEENGFNRRLLEGDACTSSSATSVDFRDLPFDMPKLRRKLRPATFSECQASSSQSVSEPTGGVLFRPSMTLSLDLESGGAEKRGLNLDLERGRGCGTMTLGAFSGVDLIDPSLPLEKQAWYHGSITRVEAERLLRTLKEGSYLVRNSESARQDYSLSLKSTRGFMHMRIQQDSARKFILGQFSKPFDTIPDMIRHYSINRLPIRGAEHMCLLKPVAARLL